MVVPIYLSAIKEAAFRIERIRNRETVRALKRRQAIVSTLLVAFGVAGTVFFGVQAQNISESQNLAPEKTFSKPVEPAEKKPVFMPESVPTHLKIASVGIDVDVITVGKAADGTIETPPLFDWVTGWYKYGPTPGEKGPAVIVGHVDTYKGISVFWRLRDVKAGDIVEVARTDGSTAKFTVTSLKQFDQANFPTQEVYGNIDHAGLRLITCGGAFDKLTGHYTQNTVVYAEMTL